MLLQKTAPRRSFAGGIGSRSEDIEAVQFVNG